MILLASQVFNWRPQVIKGDSSQMFTPKYVVKSEAVLSLRFFRHKFADLPAFGIWVDQTKGDDELLKELGNGWQGFIGQEVEQDGI